MACCAWGEGEADSDVLVALIDLCLHLVVKPAAILVGATEIAAWQCSVFVCLAKYAGHALG